MGPSFGTRSRPFLSPSSGKIAIKVIDHYGDSRAVALETRSGVGAQGLVRTARQVATIRA